MSLPTPNSTLDQFKLPLPLRFLNWAGEVSSRHGTTFVNLSEESLLTVARRRTGLSDWGDEDFRIALRVLLDSYEREAHLSWLGRAVIRDKCVGLLSNRLRIQEDLKRYPEILETPIRRPLFIAGLARTGTTLLHNLLAQDPSARVPLLWELLWPSPPPRKETRETDPRIKRASRFGRIARAVVPPLVVIHPLNPTGPEECTFLFENQFASIPFVLVASIPRYKEWLLQHDMVPEYGYYRTQLQLLQWRCPGQYWVLKTPYHLFALDALFTVFPDACVVQTHRDPQKLVASLCSLMATLRRTHSNRVVLKHLGEECLALVGTAMDRAMQVRESADPARFYDIHYQDLITDPIRAGRRLYEYFGYSFTASMEDNMKSWLRKNPQHKYGTHRYALEPFGLDPETINRRFSTYVERFNIKPE